MFKETKREGKGWRFDWVDDRGNEFRGLRFYPDMGILSSWSRKPHKMARDKFHPYRVNDNDWPRIRQACIERWNNQGAIQQVDKPKVIEFEVEVARNEWRDDEWCRRFGRCSVQEYAQKNMKQIRQKA